MTTILKSVRQLSEPLRTFNFSLIDTPFDLLVLDMDLDLAGKVRLKVMETENGQAAAGLISFPKQLAVGFLDSKGEVSSTILLRGVKMKRARLKLNGTLNDTTCYDVRVTFDPALTKHTPR